MTEWNTKLLWALRLLVLSLLFQGCDILRSSPFLVVRWSPGEGSHIDFTGPFLSLEFSHEPDRYSVERSFTCTEDGLALAGTFTWEGKQLRFYPAGGFRANRDYRINLSTDAQDTSGLSLDKGFEGVFSTRPEAKRLVFTGSSPADGGTLEPSGPGPLFEPVLLYFSHPLAVESLYQYVSFSPSIQGLWELSPATSDPSGPVTARFTPLEAWQTGKQYLCAISKDLPDLYDRPMGCAYTLHFIAGTDREPPKLLHIQALDAQNAVAGSLVFTEWYGDVGPAAAIPVNEHWERTYRIVLEFSEPVDPSSLKNRLSIQGGPGFTITPLFPPSTNFTVTFTDSPVYGNTYTLSLGAGISDLQGNTSTQQVLCKLHVNGESSKPPRLVGIRFPLAPGSGTGDYEPVIFAIDAPFADFPVQNGSDRYPYDVPSNTWMELYFDVAPNASIDPISLMESFSISATNSALSFSPRKILKDGFTWAEPEPTWRHLERVEVQGVLTNSTNAGLVTLSLSTALMDSLGNRGEYTQLLPFCK
ncbi:MAG: Ig-like domain-containing protein [Spirochaetota bacterium]